MSAQSTFPFRGPAPDRDAVVLDQATTVSLAAWRASGLPLQWLPPAFRDTGVRTIAVRRREVFAPAEEAHTPVGAAHACSGVVTHGER